MNSFKITSFLFVLLFFFKMTAQDKDVFQKLSFEQLDIAQNKEDKPAVIFLHTKWCKYCKAMKESTFKDQELITLLNKDFYFVSFDAESKEDVIFKNVKFGYKATGHNTGIHQLAQELLSQGKDKSYPAILIINKNLEILYQYSGFMDQKELIEILNLLHT